MDEIKELQEKINRIIEDFNDFFSRIGKRFCNKFMAKLELLLKLERELTLKENSNVKEV